MCVVKSLTTQTPTILNRTTHKHNTISKQLKHNSLLQLSFFFGAAPVYGDRAGRLQGGMRVAHFDHLEFRSMSFYWLRGGIIGKRFKTFID